MSLRRTSSSTYSCGIIPVNFPASWYFSAAFAARPGSQHVPPPGHIVFLKGADSKLVAHPADVVGDGTVVPLLLRDPLVEGGHLFGVPHVVLIKGLDHLVHLLFLVLAHLVHIHRAVHEGFQHPESLVLHRAGLDQDRKSTRLNSSHVSISYAVFCLKRTTE